MYNSLAMLFLAVLGASAGPSDPEPRPNDEVWMQRHLGYVANTLANPQIPIVFFGDSITERWHSTGLQVFNRLYGPKGVVNYGIGSDQIQHVHWRVINGEVQGLHPKLIVLMIGTNNLNPHNDADITRGIVDLVNRLKTTLPDAKILLIGILPRTGATEFNRIVTINAEIARLDDGNRVFFLDMFASFAGPWGTVPESLFMDGVHLTPEGYEKWSELMAPLFDRLSQ